jgi:hypothetical protein
VIEWKRLSAAVGRARGAEPLVGLLPLIVVSLVVAFLVVGTVPGSANGLFQSPISPVSPIGTIGPTPEVPPASPEATVAGPALVAVPAAPNLVPWLVGIIVVAAIVGAAMLWSRRRGTGGGGA